MSDKKDLEARLKQLLKHAEAIVASGANYNEAWNAVFGIGARYGQLFPTRDERNAIDDMPTLKKVRDLLAKAPKPAEATNEKSGQLLLRLPKSLHSALADEAETEGVSLNQLILAKLAVQLHSAVSH